MAYKIPIPTREEWQKMRDTAKVPKGAAKVSMGDAIAKAHKSFSLATTDANIKDTQALMAAAGSYAGTIKTKYPAFEAIVNTKVKKKAESHLAFLNDIKKAKVEYYPRYSAAFEAWKQLKMFGKGKPKDVAAKLANLKGCVDAFALLDDGWEAKRPRVQNVFQMCDASSAVDDNMKAALDKLFADLAP